MSDILTPEQMADFEMFTQSDLQSVYARYLTLHAENARLMAERDEAREVLRHARGVSENMRKAANEAANVGRRAAFARAKEIAEAQVIRAKRDNLSESWKHCAGEIAVAIEAEINT